MYDVQRERPRCWAPTRFKWQRFVSGNSASIFYIIFAPVNSLTEHRIRWCEYFASASITFLAKSMWLVRQAELWAKLRYKICIGLFPSSLVIIVSFRMRARTAYAHIVLCKWQLFVADGCRSLILPSTHATSMWQSFKNWLRNGYIIIISTARMLFWASNHVFMLAAKEVWKESVYPSTCEQCELFNRFTMCVMLSLCIVYLSFDNSVALLVFLLHFYSALCTHTHTMPSCGITNFHCQLLCTSLPLSWQT